AEEGAIVTVRPHSFLGYRLAARRAVDRVVERLRAAGRPRVTLPSWTHRIAIGNPPDASFEPFNRIALPAEVRARLVDDYGLWARQIASIVEVRPEWGGPIVPGCPIFSRRPISRLIASGRGPWRTCSLAGPPSRSSIPIAGERRRQRW